MSPVLEQKLSVTPASKLVGAAARDDEAMKALRQHAASLAEEIPLPDPYQQRPWKYVDLSDLDIGAYQPGAAARGRANKQSLLEKYHIEGASALAVQQNSETVLAESIQGVTVADFASVEDNERGLIDRLLGDAVPAERSTFTALHYAYLRGGILVNVAANAEPSAPVRIVRDLADPQLAAPHTLIVTGANSRVDVVEDFRSSDEEILALPIIEVLPGPGSQVRYTAIHRWGARTKVFAEQRLLGARDSAFVGTHLVVGGRLVKGHIESSLVERGSASELFGLFLGDGDQQMDFYTLQDHIGPDTRSDLLYKSALRDQARSAYYGLTRVGLGAHNADANQEDRNLLLSSEARADSDPVLEILTNDIIRCSHGATAGPVDDEQLFYLESRGIPHAIAEAMLVRAFLGQVLDRIPDAVLRDEMEAIVEAKLEGVA